MPQSQGTIEDASKDLMKYVRPRGARYMVKPFKSSDKWVVAGVELAKPQEAQQVYPVMGEVIESGHQVSEDDFLDPGTRVLYSKYSGIEYQVGDEKFVILNVEDVIAVVLPDAPDLSKLRDNR